jgi:hypothetical protein
VTKLLLAIHVLFAIVAIGPVTVAASMYPAATRRADVPALRILRRICRVYAALGVVVPVFGLATAASLGVLGDAWLLVSIALTLIAAAVLALLVLPRQDIVLATLTAESHSTEPPPALVPGRDHAQQHADAHDWAEVRAVVPTPPGMVGAGGATVAWSPEHLAAHARRLGMLTGVFNLLWAVVVVLMIVRPGSTTGV